MAPLILSQLTLTVLAVQWVVLPAIPAAWLLFGVLLCFATVITKNVIQPPLYSHRPIPVFSAEFVRWWLVQRLIGLANTLFADQLRGTAYLVWWFRALVSLDSRKACEPAAYHLGIQADPAYGPLRLCVHFLTPLREQSGFLSSPDQDSCRGMTISPACRVPE